MQHENVREALLVGEINPAVTAHLEHCPDCAALAADLQTIDQIAPSLEAGVAPPTDLVEKIRARIADDRAAGSDIPHDDFRESLLVGEINPAVTAHLEHCPDCGALAADLRIIDHLAPSLETGVGPPTDLVEKIRARIAEDRARHPDVDSTDVADDVDEWPLESARGEGLHWAGAAIGALGASPGGRVELAHQATALYLGLLLEERGDLPGAEAAYRRAIELGHGAAAYHLGLLVEGRGDLAGAETAYRRSAELGHGAAALHLGLLLKERGDLARAEDAYRRGVELAHGAAALYLGLLLEERGDLAGAEAAYRRGVELGDGAAALDLGQLLKERASSASSSTPGGSQPPRPSTSPRPVVRPRRTRRGLYFRQLLQKQGDRRATRVELERARASEDSPVAAEGEEPPARGGRGAPGAGAPAA
jgi:hypothetical protein